MALEDFDSLDSPDAAAPAPAATPLPVRAASLSATAIARKPANPDDEDLFDFPVVEMKLEAEAPKPAPVAAPAPAPAKPAKAPPAAAPAASAPAKEAPKPSADPKKAQDKKDVAKAAQLVQDIEQVLGSEVKPQKRGLKLQGPSALTLVGIAVLVLTNVFGLFFLWRTSRSFQTGVQAMNEQLVDTIRRQTLLQAQPVPSAGQGAQGSHSPDSSGPVSAPLEAFEKAALQTAREEIQSSEYAAARRRLSRLLAVADRMGAEEREEIEAQAAFLIASTYRKQAEAAREKSP